MASQFYGEGLNISPSNFPQKIEKSSRKRRSKRRRKSPKMNLMLFLENGWMIE